MYHSAICLEELKKTIYEPQLMSHPRFHQVTHSLTHGAEHFLRMRQVCSHSRTSQHFMEPEGLLPSSQEPSIGSYPELDQSNPYHPILSI
jgi:hypothetical protein